MKHLEFIDVKVGDLWPGSFSDPGTKRYFPKLTWDIYDKTFSLILDDPQTPFPEWPIYQLWNEWCAQLFGHIPSEGNTLAEGRAWAWPCVAEHFRRMAASFEKHGYQPELATGGEEHVQIQIEADGRLCVRQGNKRVALLRLFEGLDYELRVKVLRRADEWAKIKDGLNELCQGKQDLYQPVEHPDFADWTVTQPCTERWEMMCEFLREKSPSTVIDFGCHSGWFCRRFREDGAHVIGIDNDNRVLNLSEVMEDWKERSRPRINYYHEDVASMGSRYLDVCLCLSLVFHVFGRGHDAGWSFLQYASKAAPIMFLDCVWGGYADRLPFTPETIGPEIVAHTDFTEFELLGHTAHENRPFFVFRRAA